MGSGAAPRARAATNTTAAGRPSRGGALIVVVGFAFVVSVTVVIALFIVRPGGNSAAAVAFGGFAGLAVIDMIKGGAILMAATAPGRRPAPSREHYPG